MEQKPIDVMVDPEKGPKKQAEGVAYFLEQALEAGVGSGKRLRVIAVWEAPNGDV